MKKEVHHIIRQISEDRLALGLGALSGFMIDEYISTYLEEGWEIQATHIIRPAMRLKVIRRKWWEFWKHDEVTHYSIGVDVMWIMVR